MRAHAAKYLRLLGLLTLVLGISWPARADAAAFDFNDSSWEGGSEFLALARTRLGSSRVEILATVDWERLRPADAVLFMHPTVEVDYDEASAFLRAGGRVAVLDDFGKGDALLSRFHIRRIAAPLRPARALRDNPNYAIAIPSVQVVAGQEQGRHPVVAQVRELVTNHPAAFTHPNLTPVLELPAQGEPSATLAVTGIIVNRGRLFAMADPSATMNLMLRYPGNRSFAEGLVDYLVEDDSLGTSGAASSTSSPTTSGNAAPTAAAPASGKSSRINSMASRTWCPRCTTTVCRTCSRCSCRSSPASSPSVGPSRRR